MAMRRDPREGQVTPPLREMKYAVESSKVTPPSGVRPEIIEAGQQVLTKRRRLLERLAAYDRGEDPGQ
jgi:hypothetical protein